MSPEFKRINFGFDRFSGVYLAVLLIIMFGVWIPHLFLTMSTLHTIADEQPVTVMLGLAVLIPLVGGNFDLSVGATANLSGILAVVMLNNHHWNVVEAIVFSVVCSTVIGVVNGFLVVKLRVNSFIATLGVGTILTAVLDIVTGNSQPLLPSSSTWNRLAVFQVGGFESIVFYALVLAFVCWWLLDHTPFGRYLYAIGANKEASRLAGVRVNRWTWWSLTLSGAISGVAGILYVSASGPALSFGQSLLLPAFAACFLGATQLRPGRFNVWGAVLAVYVLAIGVSGLQLVTGQQWINEMFDGVALIAAVSFAVWRQSQVKDVRSHNRAVANLVKKTFVSSDSAVSETPMVANELSSREPDDVLTKAQSGE